MSILLTDEQKDLQAMVKDFVKKEVIPVAADFDIKGEFPRELFKKAVEMGLTTLTLPEYAGGAGLTNFDEALVSEELAYGDAGFAVAVGACGLAAMPLKLAGTEKQMQQLGDVLLNGGLTAFCLTESSAGSDAASLTTTARKEGNEYIINGSKTFITNGGVADFYTVFATLDKSKGAKGITAFIVERDRKGVSTGKEENKMGIRLSNTADVIFDEVRIPVENRIGQEGEGFKIAMGTLDRTRPSGSAAAVGICQRAIDLSIKYAQERITFGRPIIKNQAIQFMLADMEIQTQAARALVWQATRLQDEGIADGTFGAITKTFGGDTAMKVTTDAVQIFGGYGYSREYPVEKLMRDAKIYQIFEGTNQIQRMVIAGSLSRRKIDY